MRQLRLKGRNRFARGFRLLLIVVVLVSTLYAALLYANLLRNRRQTEQEVFDTAYKNAASLISFVDHKGFRERIFDKDPAIEVTTRSMDSRSSLPTIPSSVRSIHLFLARPCMNLWSRCASLHK